MGVLGHGLHVGQVHDGAVIGHEGRRQRQQRVAHPEALHAGDLEDKDHALLLGHLLAEHQADGALTVRSSHLGVDAVDARRQLHAAQMRLGLALGLGAGRCGRASQAGCHEQPLQRAARKRGLKRCRRLRHLAHSVAEEGWRGRKGFPARLAWSGLQLLGTGSFCPGTVQT
jgi:hypothetical protein